MNWFSSRTSEVAHSNTSSSEIDGISSTQQAICKNIINCYNTQEDCPAPWDRGVLFPDDIAGEIKVQILDPDGQFVREDPVQLKEIFKSFWSSSHRPQKVLIRGTAGIGKTTLCLRIVSEWKKNDGTLPCSSCGIVLLIFFRLRTLSSEEDLESELIKFLVCNSGAVISTLDIHGPLSEDFKTVLLLDGYNEASAKHQKQVRDLVARKPLSPFRNSSLVVTSRLEVDQDFEVLFDKHFILNGLSTEAADVLVRKYYHNSDCIVNFMLSKFQDVLRLYNASPFLLVMLCYLQRHNYDGKLQTFEHVAYQCCLEIAKRTSECRGLKSNIVELRLYELGQYFLDCLHDRKFLFTRAEIQKMLPDSVASALFRSVKYKRDKQNIMEVVHPCLMEALAMRYVDEFWSSLPNEPTLRNFVPHFVHYLSALEIYAYKYYDELCFKVIAECKDAGYLIWDFKDDSCTFSTSLIKSLIPRKMGLCKLNVNFSLKLHTKKSFTHFLSVLEKLLSNSTALIQVSYLISQFNSVSLEMNFLVNDDHQLCEAVPQLFVEENSETKTYLWTELRDMSRDINLTFLGKGCNQKDITLVISNLLNFNVKLEKETTNATELLNALKKCDERQFVCTLACVAKLSNYYLVDTKRRFAFEDLRPWTKKKFFQPKYNWTSIDMFLLNYQHNELSSFDDFRFN